MLLQLISDILDLSKMAAGYPERIKEAYEKGFITEAETRLSARRILNMILKLTDEYH